MENKYKLAILGDSISEGIGSRKINYQDELQLLLGKNYIIKNFSKTGTTIDYTLEIIDDINKFQPDIIIVMYGNVDAQLRPNIYGENNLLCKLIPKRYKKGGMLDPRPFYSNRKLRFYLDKIDNIIRKIIRKIVIKRYGVCQRVKLDIFTEKYQLFINNIDNKTTKVYLCSTIILDEKYFNGSNEQYILYNYEIQKLAYTNNYVYIDIYNYFKNILKVRSWNDIFYYDHYHPNINGYKLMAKLFAEEIFNEK